MLHRILSIISAALLSISAASAQIITNVAQDEHEVCQALQQSLHGDARQSGADLTYVGQAEAHQGYGATHQFVFRGDQRGLRGSELPILFFGQPISASVTCHFYEGVLVEALVDGFHVGPTTFGIIPAAAMKQ